MLRTTSILILSALVTVLGGCAMIGVPAERPKDEEPAPVTSTTEPVAAPVADCRVIELDALSAEVTDERERVAESIRFVYGPSAKIVEHLGAAKPDYLFIVAHGWMNDYQGSRDFSSKLIKGVLERAAKDGVDGARLAFVAVHWDSKRLVFQESALNAEVIGARRVAPFLSRVAEVSPTTRVVLVGHSLGGRLMLSTLNAEGPATGLRAHGAVLLEAAADKDSLLADRAADAFGGFGAAPGRTNLIFNVHSRQDSVLELAYANAMRSMALGREGADRSLGGESYATIKLTADPVDPMRLEGALKEPLAKWPGKSDRLVVNVDATAVVVGHSEVFIAHVYDLIWRVAVR